MDEQTYTKKPQRVSITLSIFFPAKYRRLVHDVGVDKAIAAVCLKIEKRNEIKFLEIGSDDDHIHFLVQSVPMYSVTKMLTMIKSLSAREVFKKCPHV